MKKLFVGIFLFITLLLLVPISKGVVTNSDIAQEVPAGPKTIEEWESQRREVLGEFVSVLEVQKPFVGYTYPDDKGVVVNFSSKESDVSSVLSCDARTGVYYYNYHHPLINDSAVIPTDFAIVYYPPGVDILYESDLKNPQLFSSSRNDNNLEETFHKITQLPEDGIISFVLEQTSDDYFTEIVGFGPTMTVKDFKQIYANVNFKSCQAVELIVNPTSI
ncbi:hypothetical protein [Aeromonas phage AerS_266]|nr:hypothetical protein [Aeromonas phage AerS_266]